MASAISSPSPLQGVEVGTENCRLLIVTWSFWATRPQAGVRWELPHWNKRCSYSPGSSRRFKYSVLDPPITWGNYKGFRGFCWKPGSKNKHSRNSWVETIIISHLLFTLNYTKSRNISHLLSLLLAEKLQCCIFCPDIILCAVLLILMNYSYLPVGK